MNNIGNPPSFFEHLGGPRLQAPPELSPEILQFLVGEETPAQSTPSPSPEVVTDSVQLQQQLSAQVEAGDLESALDTLADLQCSRPEPVINPQEDQLARAIQAGDVTAARRAWRASLKGPLDLARAPRPRPAHLLRATDWRHTIHRA